MRHSRAIAILLFATIAMPSPALAEPPNAELPSGDAKAFLAKVRSTLKSLKSYRLERNTTIGESLAGGKTTPVAELTFVTIVDIPPRPANAEEDPTGGAYAHLPIPYELGRYRFELKSAVGSFLLVGDSETTYWYSSAHNVYRKGDTLWSLGETILFPAVLPTAHWFPFLALSEGATKDAKIVGEEEIEVGKERRKCIVIASRVPLPDLAAIKKKSEEAAQAGKDSDSQKPDPPETVIWAGFHLSKLKLAGYLGDQGPAAYRAPAKKEQPQFTSVKMWIDKEKLLPVRLEMTENAQKVVKEGERGDDVELHVTEAFTVLEVNKDFADELFRFVPPEGARAVGATEGGASWRHFAEGGSFRTRAPDLSADGSQIVFSSPKTGHGDVYLYDIPGKRTKRLTTSEDTELSPWFRPKHRQVFFEREKGRRQHIWLYDLDTGKERQVTEGDVDTMSPDGKYMVVSRSFYGSVPEEPYVLNLDTGSKTNLPKDFSGEFRGVGDTLLGWYDEGGSRSLVEVKLDGTIVKNHGKDYDLWVKNSGERTVVAKTKDTKEYQINSELTLWDKGKSESIGQGHSSCMFDNGKVLFFTGYERDAWIWESGRQARKIDSPRAIFYVPRRTVGNRAAFTSWKSQDEKLYLFDAETERFERIDWEGSHPPSP